ncbi:SPOR domain-containing protein [Desulfovibrio gilichinskyi]|uniref:Sporulation related domain-containing protein n=1 Tax=Desulfovibrio gilichinskyi TaxID=1519643 RepID=A0A1X7D639_9BACT|nr:SPOR domain-containing protein [Desulfovibrio gilichinskyi]SMF09180.1 Sporulation related domain-containing protein [Desulfovibrio gilichinskyi]
MKKVKDYKFIISVVTCLLLLIFTPLLQAKDTPSAVVEKVWTVRVSTFENESNAWDFVKYLKSNGYKPVVIRIFDSKYKLWTAVQIGDYPTRSQAVASASSFKRKMKLDYQVKGMDREFLAERTAVSQNAPLPARPDEAAPSYSVKRKVVKTALSSGKTANSLRGVSEDSFYELTQDDVLRDVSNLQRKIILTRIMIRRGYISDGIRMYEELVKTHPEDMNLREEYISTLIDNEEYNKAGSLLQSWLEDDPAASGALSLSSRIKFLTGDYSQQQASLNYLLKLRPGDTDALSSRAYGRQDDGDWLGAIESFSELIDRDPENVDARQALSGLLKQHRPRLNLTPRVYLQTNDTITTSMNTNFSMQLDELTRGEFIYDFTQIYRPAGDGIEKVDKTVNRGAFLFRRDLTRTFTGILGVGAFEGTAEGFTGALGFDWLVSDSGPLSLMLDYNNPWTDEPSAANYKGRYNQISMTYDGFYNDTWGLFMNGQVRQYVVDNDRLYGTKGVYNVILTRKLLDNPELYVSYSYYRSHFKYDDDNYTPIAMVQNESIHTLSTSFSKWFCDSIGMQVSGGIRQDEFKSSPSYFASPNLLMKLGERWEFNAGYEYSSDSGLVGGGESQAITGGINYVF